MTPTAEKSQIQPPLKAPTAVQTKPKRVQEKMMGLLTVAFIGGVILYSVMPEGPLRGMSIGGFSLLMTYLLFRFGI